MNWLTDENFLFMMKQIDEGLSLRSMKIALKFTKFFANFRIAQQERLAPPKLIQEINAKNQTKYYRSNLNCYSNIPNFFQSFFFTKTFPLR